MKRLLEIFIFLLSFIYANKFDTDVSHIIVDHKGNSVIALIDSMDLDNIYYKTKIDNKSLKMDLDKYTSFIMILIECIIMAGVITRTCEGSPIGLVK